MIKRLVIFQVILLSGLSLIWALPKSPPMQDAALNTELPNFLTLSGWRGQKFGAPSQQELEILSRDTDFFRRNYHREVTASEQLAALPGGKGPVYSNLLDVLNAGIVLSGTELANSIHALERCLTAQGFNIPSASTMRITLRSGHILPVRRLVCERADGKGRVERSIAYYWFVGHDCVTSNHIVRGVRDFWDRVIGGYDQHWAYITVTAYLDAGPVFDSSAGTDAREPRPVTDDGGHPLYRRALNPDQADRLVEEFIADLGPDIMKVDQIKNWPASKEAAGD